MCQVSAGRQALLYGLTQPVLRGLGFSNLRLNICPRAGSGVRCGQAYEGGICTDHVQTLCGPRSLNNSSHMFTLH